MKIHISETTKELLDKSFDGWFVTELRGPVEMKGKGLVTTYWLTYEKMTPDDSSGFTELEHYNQSLPLRENYNFHHRSSRIIDLVNESYEPEMAIDPKYADEMHPKLDSGKKMDIFCLIIWRTWP